MARLAVAVLSQWLGKYSSTNKTSRLTRELTQHTALSIGQGFQAIRQDYIPFLRKLLVQPLLTSGKDAVDQVIAYLEYYGLTKDDLMESLRELQFKVDGDPAFADVFDKLDSQTKAALTRAYNSTAHISQTAVPVLGARKPKSRAVADDWDGAEQGEEALEADLLSESDQGDEENEEEDVKFLKEKLVGSTRKPGAKGRAPKASGAQPAKPKESAKAKAK